MLDDPIETKLREWLAEAAIGTPRPTEEIVHDLVADRLEEILREYGYGDEEVIAMRATLWVEAKGEYVDVTYAVPDDVARYLDEIRAQ